MQNKIGIIGIRGLPAMYGAFDRFVEQFVNSIQTKHKNIFFYIGCDTSFKKYKFYNQNVNRIFTHRGGSFYILFSYLINIIKMYFMGVRCFVFFGYGAAPLFIFLKILNCKIICNPDGIEWRRPEKKIKKIYFKLCEKIISRVNIKRIYDSKVIERYYNINHTAKGKTLYYPSVFENLNHHHNHSIKKKYERFYIIGRLLEENNTEMIVKAFTKFDMNKRLYIIGNSNDYFEKIIKPYLHNSKNIFYIGSIYDKKKLFKICNLFDYYIHGHSVGGTNPTLIEAISIQKSTIAFKTSFNKEILLGRAAYFKNDIELFNIINNGIHHKIRKPIFRNEFTSNYINKEYFKLINE